MVAMIRRGFLAGGAMAAVIAACARPEPKPVPDARAEAAYPPIGRLVEAEDGLVHATDEGEGGPPAILLHGANANLRDWTFSVSGRLAQDRRVVAMDRPGFGYSSREAGAWTPGRQARRLRAAARAMGVERPVIVGHSWGAAVALAWALDAPDEVSGVVSVSGMTMPWGVGADIMDALGVGEIGVAYYTARLTRTAENGGVEAFIARAFRPQTPPPGFVAYVGAPLSLRAGALAANSADLAGTQRYLSDLAPRYRDLAVPAAAVHGAADWLLDPERHAIAFAARAPRARVAVLDGVGHMAHHARPEALAEALAAFG
jgi:pimeloyl-ACP methyl ester carboxylesterase